MRFKNLTITIALGCLSIVALAALVMLPITSGICEWTGDEQNKSYWNSSVDIEQEAKPNDFHNWSKDTQMGRGWSISASLNASGTGAYANVSPSIYGLIAFTNTETYGGSENVCASISEMTISVCPVCGDTHLIDEDTDSNKDKERTLAAKVVEIEVEWWKMKGNEITKKGGHKIEGGAEGKFDVKVVEVSVKAGYEWTTENGKTFKEYERTKFKRKELAKGDSQGQSASVGSGSVETYWNVICGGRSAPVDGLSAETGASLDFHFSGHSSSNSVSHTP